MLIYFAANSDRMSRSSMQSVRAYTLVIHSSVLMSFIFFIKTQRTHWTGCLEKYVDLLCTLITTYCIQTHKELESEGYCM